MKKVLVEVLPSPILQIFPPRLHFLVLVSSLTHPDPVSYELTKNHIYDSFGNSSILFSLLMIVWRKQVNKE